MRTIYSVHSLKEEVHVQTTLHVIFPLAPYIVLVDMLCCWGYSDNENLSLKPENDSLDGWGLQVDIDMWE